MMQRTRDHMAQRTQLLQQRIQHWQVDGLLITNPVDIRYLTGFVGDDSWAVVQAQGKRVHVLSDARFTEQIKREAPQVMAHIRQKGLADELAKVAGSLRMRTLAVSKNHVTLAQMQALRSKVKGVKFKAVDDGLVKQRAVKDEGEIKLIQKALVIQQKAFIELLPMMQPGISENDLAAELEYRMRRLGADGPSFNTIVAFDANAALPHAIPGPRKLKGNGLVLIDWGAKFGGYCSDLTRVVAVGRVSAKLRHIYEVCREAQLAAIEAIGPGKSVKDIDKVARDIITKAGFGKQFGHGLGHGIGLDIHEQPVLSWRAEDRLQAGQVVTVEPGIYLPGLGGVRLEDDVLVTSKGKQVLSELPLDMDLKGG